MGIILSSVYMLLLQVIVDVTNNAMEVVFSRTQYCSLLDTMEAMDQSFVQQRYHKYRDKLHFNKKNISARAWCVCVCVSPCASVACLIAAHVGISLKLSASCFML